MADNSVTIALKLDTSQFNSGISQIESEIKKVSQSVSGGSSGKGMRVTWLNKQDIREMENSTKELEKTFKAAARFDMANLRKDAKEAEKIMNASVKMNKEAYKREFKIDDIDFGVSDETEESLKSARNTVKEMSKDMEEFVVSFSSMTGGNMSPSNVLRAARSAHGIITQASASGARMGSGGQAALAGIEGIGAEGAGAAAASTGAASVGGTIGAFFGQLIGIVVGIASVLALIAAGIFALIVGISALGVAFKPILKILQAIGRVLGATLVPISMVIMTLLQPLIWVLMPFVRLMNAIFRPLRTAMAEFFKKNKELIKSGDLFGILGGLFDALKPAIVGLVSAIGSIVMPLFGLLGEWIIGFLTINLDELKMTLEKLLGKDLGDTVSMFINVLHWAISAVAGFAAQLAGEENFDKLFGAGAFEDVMKKNEGAAAGKGLAETLQKLWTIFNEWITAFTNDPLGTVYSTMIGAITSFTSNIKQLLFGTGVPKGLTVGTPNYKPSPQIPVQDTIETVFEEKGLIGAINMLVSQFTGIDVGKFWADLNTYWADTLKPVLDKAWTTINKFLTTEWASMLTAFTSLNNSLGTAATAFSIITGTWLADQIKSAIISWLGPKPKDSGSGVIHNDFIMRPGQGAVSFSPNDTVFGLKNPGSLSDGGNSTSIVINVSGNVDDKTARFITDTVQREIAQQWRAIAR